MWDITKFSFEKGKDRGGEDGEVSGHRCQTDLSFKNAEKEEEGWCGGRTGNRCPRLRRTVPSSCLLATVVVTEGE